MLYGKGQSRQSYNLLLDLPLSSGQGIQEVFFWWAMKEHSLHTVMCNRSGEVWGHRATSQLSGHSHHFHMARTTLALRLRHRERSALVHDPSFLLQSQCCCEKRAKNWVGFLYFTGWSLCFGIISLHKKVFSFQERYQAWIQPFVSNTVYTSDHIEVAIGTEKFVLNGKIFKKYDIWILHNLLTESVRCLRPISLKNYTFLLRKKWKPW